MMRLIFLVFAGYVAYRIFGESGLQPVEATARAPRGGRRRPSPETKSTSD